MVDPAGQIFVVARRNEAIHNAAGTCPQSMDLKHVLRVGNRITVHAVVSIRRMLNVSQRGTACVAGTEKQQQ